MIHLSPAVTREDIENEVRAIDKLWTDPPSQDIVQIFRHGWLKSATRQNSPLPMYFIDMELGQYSLEKCIKDSTNGVRRGEALYIMLQVSAGISFIHRKGMIHRDLKPANSKTVVSLKLMVSHLNRFRFWFETLEGCGFRHFNNRHFEATHCYQRCSGYCALLRSRNSVVGSRNPMLHQQSRYLESRFVIV